MSNQGIVSARHVDHVGMTVPNLDEAIRFFEDALGGLLLWRVGPFHETATGVPINSVQIAMLRLGPSFNVELLEFNADQQNQVLPSNVDMGAGHIAFFVDDIGAAAESLRNHGAELLEGPLEGAGEDKRDQALRRTCATHFQKHGGSRDIQAQLRQFRLETTGQYVKEIPNKVRAAVESLDRELCHGTEPEGTLQ